VAASRASLVALALAVAASAGLFALLSAHDRSADAARHARNTAFAQTAKQLCVRARHELAGAAGVKAAATLEATAASLTAIPEPANVHVAVLRLARDWRTLAALARARVDRHTKVYRLRRNQVSLSAHALNVKACADVVPA
jgi:hypothetical protein